MADALNFAPPALAPAPTAPGFILLVEDNPGDARLTQSLLENTADVTWPTLRWVQTLAGAIQTLEQESDCQAVLLDLGLPDAQGLESLQAILPYAAHRPVVVLTGDGNDAIGLAAVQAGAQDFMVKGSFDGSALRRSLVFAGQRKRVQQDLLLHALRDDVTDLPRRALLIDRLQATLKQCRRNQTCGALLFVDIDHFKQINDSFGHAAGDQALRIVAERLAEGLRETDSVARVGGDEFIVLLPGAGLPEDAEAVGRMLLARLAVPVDFLGRTLQLSASIGVTMFDGLDETAEHLMRRADKAMYAAKAAGRGRVVLL